MYIITKQEEEKKAIKLPFHRIIKSSKKKKQKKTKMKNQLKINTIARII